MNGTNDCKPFYGKYRGTVVQNVDPDNRGRLLVSVPDVLGQSNSWAECCTALAGPTGASMGSYFIPPTGAGVWVEFEHGEPDYPVWVGCRFGANTDLPLAAKQGLPLSPSIILQTNGKNKLIISDAPGQQGGIMLESTSGASIIVNDTGIYISNGKNAKITLVGPTVKINEEALVVT